MLNTNSVANMGMLTQTRDLESPLSTTSKMDEHGWPVLVLTWINQWQTPKEADPHPNYGNKHVIYLQHSDSYVLKKLRMQLLSETTPHAGCWLLAGISVANRFRTRDSWSPKNVIRDLQLRKIQKQDPPLWAMKKNTHIARVTFQSPYSSEVAWENNTQPRHS